MFVNMCIVFVNELYVYLKSIILKLIRKVSYNKKCVFTVNTCFDKHLYYIAENMYLSLKYTQIFSTLIHMCICIMYIDKRKHIVYIKSNIAYKISSYAPKSALQDNSSKSDKFRNIAAKRAISAYNNHLRCVKD